MTSRMTSIDTLAVHAGREDLAGLGAHVPPIDLSSTYPLPDVTVGGDSYEALATGGRPIDGGSLVYQRLWNPTVARFEDALARMEGTAEAVAFGSGMAALTAILLASPKKHVVAVRPLYGGSDHLLATGMLGTEVTWASADGVAAAIRPDTGLVILETPANPTLDLVDISAVAAAAGDVPVLVDNTFATPVLQRPAEHGATLVLHSATKYLGGHGDVLGGVVACPPEWAARLRSTRAITGGLLHPLAGYMLHRGLQTLPVRIRAQQDAAIKLADALIPLTERVYYPGADPLVGRQMSGPGAILAFAVRGGYEAASRVASACQLATHAVSLGGVDTLIQHPAALTHRPVAAEAKPHGNVLRVSVGLEDPADIIADLTQALSA
ncbi:trans-sulfuration enzyme family protein [Longispora albida]|uniref:trans-sulfuration enzyme family protein n=1 Tax=Longispora albida TaxID=203523 RepID=UPI00037D3D3B|nr:PLP-dependent aspartate aminotransferase family protein [Longispora albida]